MKVLELLCEPISNGGQEAFVMNVYNNIDMTDMHIDLFTPYYCDNDYYKMQVKKRGGKVYARGLDFNPGGLKFNIIAPIRAIIRKNKYDVVHIHTGSVLSMACAAFAAKLEHVKKIIVHSHCTADAHNIKRDTIKMLSTPIINKSATDFCACSEEAGEWKYSKKICKNRLKVINNGINLEKFRYDGGIRKKIREELGIDENTVLLGHVGRFSYEKNQEYLIDLFNKLDKKEIDVRLILIGSGETFDDIKKQVGELGLSDKVIFQGNVNNVNDYMQAMDILLFPSRFEGLGIVAIEAQAAGLPVIISENVPDDVMITDGVKKVRLDNPDKWLTVIKAMIENRNNRSRYNTANELKEAGYDIKKTASDIRKLYGCDNKKRVLVFGMTPNYGGVESFILNYYSNMDHDRITIDFLCNTYDDIAYTGQLQEMGSTIYHITPKGSNPIKYKKELKRFFENNAYRYDAIWVNVCNLVNVDYLKMAKKYGIGKRIIHSHNSAYYEHNWRDLMHAIHKILIRRYATDYWACSKDAALWFYTGKALRESKVIYNAIDIEKLSFSEEKRNQIRKSYNLENRYVIGNVGRLTYQKNQIFLLDVIKKMDDDTRLVIVGQGEEEAKLKTAAKNMGVSDKVIFAGAQTDIQGWLSAFDVFAFPSHYEGFGIATLEAQANGLPIVASKDAIVEETIVNDNISICNAGALDAWVKVLNEKEKSHKRLNCDAIEINFDKTSLNVKNEAIIVQEML